MVGAATSRAPGGGLLMSHALWSGAGTGGSDKLPAASKGPSSP